MWAQRRTNVGCQPAHPPSPLARKHRKEKHMSAQPERIAALPQPPAVLPQTQATLHLPRELLLGRVAIVTGGSRGIGRATVLRLAEAGAKVVVNYKVHDTAAEQTAYLARQLGADAIAVAADISHGDEAREVAEATVKQFGRIDLLVANAGIWQGAPVETMSEYLWDCVIDANLRGTWAGCRAVVPVMKRQH